MTNELRKCDNCGTEIPETHMYCKNCGRTVPDSTKEDT